MPGQSLFVTGQSTGGTISFSAAGPRPIPGAPAHSGLPTVEFDLSYKSERHGTKVATRAVAISGSDRLSVTSPAGNPSAAAVKPPPPFAGSATFQWSDHRCEGLGQGTASPRSISSR